MLSRLTHAAFAFAVTAFAYQAYVVGVAPFIEPARADEATDARVSLPEPSSLHKHRDLLAAYFPPEHWSLQEAPMTIESGHAMIVVDDYRQSNDGKLRIGQCVMIYFPQGRKLGAAPPRNAIVLEAPHGAVLQMDSAGSSGFGKIQWGELQGRVRIYSDMNQAGPGDDLHIVTSALRLNESGLNTREAVELQLGQHRGRGRGLEIRRASSDSAKPSRGMLSDLDTLEITSEVTVALDVGRVKLLNRQPSRRPEELSLGRPKGGPAAKQPDVVAGARATPPIRIRCDGAFRFDFANSKASFLQNVVARQIHADGTLDQLLADEVNLYLIKDAAREESDAESGSSKLGGGLKAGTLEAKGSPVSLKAPSQRASMRGERVRIEFPQRRVTVDGGDEVTLSYQGSEIHAPMVRYQSPPQDSNQRIGEMSARGRGWLKAVVDQRRPKEPLEVSWSTSMRIDRASGQPVLSVIGRPRLRMPGVGRLMADQIYVFLRERLREDQGQPERSPEPFDEGPAVAADRLAAQGNVSIDSPELNCRVNELTLWMKYLPPRDSAGRPATSEAKTPETGGPSSALANTLRRDGRGRAYAVHGDKLALEIAVRNREPEVARVSVEGNVLFQESQTRIRPGGANEGSDPPLRITGRQLRVDDADTADAQITIVGDPARNDQPAEITVRGTTIRAPELRVSRGSSEAWINAAGEVRMQVDRDLSGKQLDRSEPLTIRWRESMHLNGDQITFDGGVLTRSAAGWLQTPRLVVRLSEPVRFDGASTRRAAGRQPELAQIECYDGVLAQFEQRDQVGLTAIHRVELRSLIANQVTGRLQGAGPGKLESVHLSSGNPFSELAGETANAAADASQSAQKLRYLRTDFRRQVSGNLLERRIVLHGNVRTVYGPVDAWEQKLNVIPGESLAPETVYIECATLGVAESPTGRLFAPPGQQGQMGPIELTAEGRVTIEGQDPKQGLFTARGHRATYDQLKTMFILEGNAAGPAKVWRQEFVGGPSSVGSGQKFQYWLNTGKAAGVGFRWEFSDFQRAQ